MEDKDSPRSLADIARQMCKDFIDFSLPPTQFISPFLLHYVYRSSAIYQEIYGTTGDTSATEGLAILQEALQMLDWRWKSAGT